MPTKNNSKKNIIKKAKKDLDKTPNKNKERRKSSIPLQLREIIKNNGLNRIIPDSSTKNSYKGDSAKKNYLRDIINSSIPEVSEKSSNNKDEKNIKVKIPKKHKKDKKEKEKVKEIENNNYYIHFIKNVYENEPHLNKERFINNAKIVNKTDNNDYLKFINSNKNIKPLNKRRNSCINGNILKSNFQNMNLILDKEIINTKKAGSINQKDGEIGSFLNKIKKDEKDKNKSKNKSKEKSKIKNKNKKKDDDNDDGEDNCIYDININKNRNIINKKKKVKNTKLLEIEKKTDTENNNTENINNQNKKSIFKKFLCCFINNGDSSIEND